VPVNVTPVVPTVPLLGETVRAALTVKVVEALAVPESVAVIVRAPLVELGTVKVADQLPFAATVCVPLIVNADPPNVTPVLTFTVAPAL
jgi:hypothetical protein